MFDFTVFRGFSGAHWVVFDCMSGRTLATGHAETVEAAHDAAAFECAAKQLRRDLDALLASA